MVNALDMLDEGGVGVAIQPATWLLNEVPASTKVLNTIAKMDSHIIDITLFRGEDVFDDAVFAMPLSITTFQHQKRSTPIHVEDKINNTTYEASCIGDITKHGDDKKYPIIRSSIMSYIETHSSLRDHLLRKDQEYNYYVRLPILIGNLDKAGKPKNDFYCFITKSQETIYNHLPENNKRCVGFNTRSEAENFVSFLKLPVARFCLSIAKFDRSLNPITLSTTPWLDFSRKWSNDDVYKELNLHNANKLIESIISPYYY